MQSYQDHFSAEYRELLREISDNFRQNLIRHIKNDADRHSRRNPQPIKFNDVGLATENQTILLENLYLTNIPVFNLRSFQVDFENLCLDVKFEMNPLNFECDYTYTTANNVSDKMKIEISASKITANGRIGIFTEEDSFMPTTYDINYNFCDIAMVDPENMSADTAQTLFALFLIDLRSHLNNALHRVIGGNIVDYSLLELMIDEPEHIRNYEKMRNNAAEPHFDALIKECISTHAKHNESGMISFKTDGPLKFDCKNARLTDYNSFHRTSKVSVFEDMEKVVYCANFELENFTYEFEDVRANLNGKDYKCDLKLSPRHNKFFARLILYKNGKREINIQLKEILNLGFGYDYEEANEEFCNCILPYLSRYVQVFTESALQKMADDFNKL